MIPKRRTRPRMLTPEVIEDRSMPEPNSGCWLWIGGYSKAGYGMLPYEGTRLRAHRVSYAVFKAPIPDGAFVCHRCDNRACVNPDHLFLGDHLINNRDMFKKGRRPTPCGERCGFSRLSEAQARAIFADKRPTRFVAADYGVAHTCVRKIRAKITWKHIHAAKPQKI